MIHVPLPDPDSGASAHNVTDWSAPVQRACYLHTQIGMALGPGEHEHQVVAASVSGELKYMDFRLTEGNGHLSGQSSSESGSGQLVSSGSGVGAARIGIWKRVQPEDHAPISTFAAHPYAPLLSTFSPQSQVSPRPPCKSTELPCNISFSAALIASVWQRQCRRHRLLDVKRAGDCRS